MPWVVLSEVIPTQARTAGGSIGVCLNWLTNFVAGTSFLPIQDLLKDRDGGGGGGGGEGNVFYVFAVNGLMAFGGIWGSYRLYERVKG